MKILIKGGRVIDPSSGRDEVADVLIASGRIVTIGKTADTAFDPKGTSGYVGEKYAIELAQQAGFELVGSSEVNANPKDTRDYEQGVWTLPPSLRLGDKDREKYVAIGESDRFTLRFRKPLTAAAAPATN